MGRLIRWLSVLAVLGAGGWSLWWYAGARGQEAGAAAWLDNQRERGWQAEAGNIEVVGFPLDFRMRATDLALADPWAGWAWRAPELRAESVAYKPTRIAVDWPSSQTLAVPGDHTVIRSDRMRTLLDLRPGPAMELRQASTDVAMLRISARSGWQAGADLLLLDLAEKPPDLGPPNSYDLKLEAMELVLPKHLVVLIDPTGWLRPRIDRLTVVGHGAFDRALGREVVEVGELGLRAATIREAGFEWGDMRLVVKGAFEVDDAGFPVGKLRIEAYEWRQMVRLAVTSGLIDLETARTVTKAIEFVTALAGTGDNLSAPIGLSDGKIRIGPIAIADAPRLAPPRY